MNDWRFALFLSWLVGRAGPSQAGRLGTHGENNEAKESNVSSDFPLLLKVSQCAWLWFGARVVMH